MGRYLTRRYVAVSWDEAVRLARLDQTPIEDIRYSAEAELIHRTEWWAWWSDGLLTSAIGLPESLNPQGLFPDAVELISSVWASNSPQPECGWSLLAQVRRILASERISVEMDYTTGNSPRWERLSIELCDGQHSTLYRLYVGDVDGYLCEIRTDPPE